MRYFILNIALLLLGTSCFAQEMLSKSEDKILDMILKLPEVRKDALYTDSISLGKRALIAIIKKKPSKQNNYYWIAVMDIGKEASDTNDMAFTHLHFYVYPKTLEIKLYDPVDDKILTLKEWRKLRKKTNTHND
ncbi:MAG: hypothetical protein H0X33_09910 [Taibaiella sp.]|nr:hypothetical protein [Taibaiella sp.]